MIFYGFFVVLLSLFSVVSAGNIATRAIVNGTNTVDDLAFVELIGGEYSRTVAVGVDGDIFLPAIPTGEYVFSLRSQHYVFDTYQVRVSETGVSARPVPTGEEPRRDSPDAVFRAFPSLIVAKQKLDYYPDPKAFQLLGFLMANKMMVFMAAGMLISVFLPKLLNQLDPEVMAEVQQNQRDLHSRVSSLTNKLVLAE